MRHHGGNADKETLNCAVHIQTLCAHTHTHISNNLQRCNLYVDSVFITNLCSFMQRGVDLDSKHVCLVPPNSSFTEVPCVQRPALWKRVAASPRLSADDQDTGHAVHRWQVNTRLHPPTPPSRTPPTHTHTHQYTLSSLWQGNRGVRGEKKSS